MKPRQPSWEGFRYQKHQQKLIRRRFRDNQSSNKLATQFHCEPYQKSNCSRPTCLAHIGTIFMREISILTQLMWRESCDIVNFRNFVLLLNNLRGQKLSTKDSLCDEAAVGSRVCFCLLLLTFLVFIKYSLRIYCNILFRMQKSNESSPFTLLLGFSLPILLSSYCSKV